MGSCHKDYLRRAFLYVQFVNVPTQVFYDGLLKALFLPLALGLSPEINTMCHSTLKVDSTNSCRKKTDMSSTQSNKTPRFRCSIKYLKLMVVLQKIVCLVSVLLAPKLVFYISTNELLFTNFKDAAYSSRP